MLKNLNGIARDLLGLWGYPTAPWWPGAASRRESGAGARASEIAPPRGSAADDRRSGSCTSPCR